MGSPASPNFMNESSTSSAEDNEAAGMLRDVIMTPFFAGMFQGFGEVTVTFVKQKWAARKAARVEREKLARAPATSSDA